MHVNLDSGEPLGFVNVFTAFGIGLLGLIISFVLLLIEMLTAKYGTGNCKKLLNAYNYRIDKESNSAMDKCSSPVFTTRGDNQRGPLNTRHIE